MRTTKFMTLCAVLIIGLGIFAGFLIHYTRNADNQPAGKTIIYDKRGDHVTTLTVDGDEAPEPTD